MLINGSVMHRHEQDHENGTGNGYHSKEHVLGFSAFCSNQVLNVNCDCQLELLALSALKNSVG